MLKVLAGVAFGILCACLMAELMLRFAGYENVVLTQFDADLGRLGRPHLSGMQNSEGRNRVVFNAHGYHDVEHPLQKVPGTFRIIVLGDSFSAGVHVELANTYAQRLVPELAACKSLVGRPIEIVNLAVNGYNLHQIYLTEKDVVPEYSPDLIFVAITPNPGLLSPGAVEASLSPVVTFNDDTPLVSRKFRNSLTYKLKTSGIYAFFIELSDHVRLLQFLMEAEFRARTAMTTGNHPEPHNNSSGDDAAWDASNELIAQIANLSKSRGVPLLFALTAPDEIDPLHPPTVAVERRDERYKQIFAELPVDFLSIADDMRSYSVTHQVYLNGFGTLGGGTGHWNNEGNKVAAQLYAAGLCTQLSVSFLKSDASVRNGQKSP